ncbi:MAG: 3-hydroxyacyl-CoA dehydrogenase/enoyl-CoA hydratase family protein [Candidatus Neomarinimicrobiota bacterium]|nr:MAG: 3-hydroxyacyl-CoA dehydrogenase/enoyl-CoA hydratase family protein [Candidatus Neomarinimicrobiota bacterium]
MKITTVGIVGAGTMGSALAQKFAMEGCKTRLVDQGSVYLERGLERIRRSLEEGKRRGLFREDQIEAITGRIHTTTDLKDLKDCDLVIEAVYEDLQVKRDLFGQLSGMVTPDTILATNTSSFLVKDLHPSVKRPRRFLGLHFFYHAAKNRLVEVIPGPDTDPAVVERVLRFMQRIGKDPIQCRDSNGFVVNRFFVPWLNEAVRLWEEDVAAPGDIDAIACDVFGCGLGPFALMNATGVPIAYHAQKTLETAYGAFYRPAAALKRQAEAGQNWDIQAPSSEPDTSVTRQVRDRLLGAVLFVCEDMLRSGVCTAGDISRGAGVGLRWSRTPVTWARELGTQETATLIQSIRTGYHLPEGPALEEKAWIPDWVSTDIRGRVGILTINRPEGLNALNPLVMDQLDHGFTSLLDAPEVDRILIRGMGKAFVAGADIKFFVDHIEQGTIDEILAFTRYGQDVLQRIDQSPKEVVALINGLALGGGLELACAADHILALPGAKMAFPETGLGIYPGLGGTFRPQKRIGKGLTRYLVLTGTMLSADKALSLGLVDRILTWEEMETLLDGRFDEPFSGSKPDPTWLRVERLFTEKSLEELISGETLTEEERNWVKSLKYKGPRALEIADTLIREERGREGELEFLPDIFRTRDTYRGLQAVLQGTRPQFEGA